jgi:glucose-1-phosphate adenylyltransferase
MINANSDALGIIFPNTYDGVVPELTKERLMASIPFASRYRLIDFTLSSLVNSGISNISIATRENYLSLLDHLGSGREWDLARKNGGLNIVPPFAQKEATVYHGRVEALYSLLTFLGRQKEEYVVMTDSNLAINFDYKAFLQTHIESGADVTMAYHVIHNPENPKTSLTPIVDGQYFTLEVDAETGKVQEIKINTPIKGTQNSCLNIYVMKRQLLIDLIAQSYVDGDVYFERDILVRKGANLDIRAYRYDGYVARIISIKSYFDENMKLLDEKNLDALFGGGQIYTKIRDDHPTRYAAGSKAKNVMAADGCIIEGEVENCVLFRGVKIAKGAKVRNSVLMQDTVIEEGADVNYIITDKNVVVSAGQTVSGTESFPVCIGKNQKV